MLQEEQQEFNRAEYLQRMNSIIDFYLAPREINIGDTILKSILITVPIIIGYCGISSLQRNHFRNIRLNHARHICTDKYGRDKNGLILNSCGLPKNPQTADDLPDHDITFDMIKPSPIDQHGTCGIAVD